MKFFPYLHHNLREGGGEIADFSISDLADRMAILLLTKRRVSQSKG